MMDLSERLTALGFAPGWPLPLNGGDFLLQDDGEGPYVKEWRSSRPQPSDAELVAVALPEPVVVVPAAVFWSRTTDEEADAIDAAMQKASVKIRNLWRTEDTYRSDGPLWPTLSAKASELFGEARAAELLAA